MLSKKSTSFEEELNKPQRVQSIVVGFSPRKKDLSPRKVAIASMSFFPIAAISSGVCLPATEQVIYLRNLFELEIY
jgi:hypothetical protein